MQTFNAAALTLKIQHFSALSENIQSKHLFEFMKHLIDSLLVAITETGGTFDGFSNGIISAHWKNPGDATIATLECLAAVKQVNKQLELDPGIEVLAGLAQGECTEGTLGPEERTQQTALGSATTLSSDLADGNSFFGVRNVIDESCFLAAKDRIAGRTLGRIHLIGRRETVRVCEVLSYAGELSEIWTQACDAFHSGVEQYNQRNFTEAKKAFLRVLELVPNDQSALMYARASEDYEAVPPGEGWEPVFNLTS